MCSPRSIGQSRKDPKFYHPGIATFINILVSFLKMVGVYVKREKDFYSIFIKRTKKKILIKKRTRCLLWMVYKYF